MKTRATAPTSISAERAVSSRAATELRPEIPPHEKEEAPPLPVALGMRPTIVSHAAFDGGRRSTGGGERGGSSRIPPEPAPPVNDAGVL